MPHFEVTARSGLNIRRLPEAASPALVAMPRGMVCEQIGPSVWYDRWLNVRAVFSENYYVEGYCVRDYLRRIDEPSQPSSGGGDGGHGSDGGPVSGIEIDAGLSSSVVQLKALTAPKNVRRELNELHLDFRKMLDALLEACARDGLPFVVFEAYRQPDRQAFLYAQSRTSPGPKVTDADAWQSIHNYGMAADLVLHVHNVNPWETGRVGGKDYSRDWTKMRRHAERIGLKLLSWDLPHVEYPGTRWQELQRGQFPPGGGTIWGANIQRMAAAFPDNAPTDFSGLFGAGATGTPTGSQGEAPLAPPAPPPEKTTDLAKIGSIFTPAAVSGMFDPSVPKENIERNLPIVLEALNAAGLGDWPYIITALGTIKAETARFESIPEGRSRYNTDEGGRPFGRYDFRTDIGNNAEGDGAKYKGRGFIQLTGKDNYRKYGERLGIDLVHDPERALEPEIAARLLAEFLKDKKDRIATAWANEDWATARRLVNGGSHGLDVFSGLVAEARRRFDWRDPLA